jgi:hypothetical protein
LTPLGRGAETSDEGGDVGGIGHSNGPVPRSVALDGETEALGTGRVNLYMVELREAVDKEGGVRGVGDAHGHPAFLQQDRYLFAFP